MNAFRPIGWFYKSPDQPPYTNKGGNPPPVVLKTSSGSQHPQVNIDWLQYTCTWPDDIPIEDHMIRCVPPYPEFAILPEEVPGISGYTDGRAMRIGRLYWHAKMRSQRVLVVLSGDDWQSIAQANIDPMIIMDWLIAKDHRITRVDLAMDLFNWDAHYLDVREWFDHDAMACDAERCGLYDDHRKLGGKRKTSGTVYVGSSASDRQLRVYDKGAEQESTQNWLRVELVLRADRARAWLASAGGGDLPTMSRTAFADFVLAPDTWFERAIEGKLIDLKPIGKRDTDTVKWLLNVVHGALERELINEKERGESKLSEKFGDLINRYR